MGVDFIRDKRQSRRKAWNFQVSRGSQDLLATISPVIRRTCRAKLDGALPDLGHIVVLHLTQDREVLVREQNFVIGRVANPKPELVNDLSRHSGMATASVKSRLSKSNAVDLLIED